MTRRFVSVWLPYWPTDRLRRQHELTSGRYSQALRQAGQQKAPQAQRQAPAARALVLIQQAAGTQRLYAVNEAARKLGLKPQMGLSDARAMVPDVATAMADAAADAAALKRLCRWCLRYTPWVAVDGVSHLRLEITGAAHLLGGEAALLDDLYQRLQQAGITARLGLADNVAAAWAVARFMTRAAAPWHCLVQNSMRQALAPLPVAALRLPSETVTALQRLGIRRIADLLDVPTAPLRRRYGADVARQLNRLLGDEEAPFAAAPVASPFIVRRYFAEPIAALADILAATELLLQELVVRLQRAGQGMRRLHLQLCLADGDALDYTLGLARTSRDIPHIMALLQERLGALDAGFGADCVILSVLQAEPLSATALALGLPQGNNASALPESVALPRLIDRLVLRFGRQNVGCLQPVAGHQPEQAMRPRPALASAAGHALDMEDWPESLRRPLLLLRPPQPVEVMAEVPDGPPLLFRWRRHLHRVVAAEGPERIAPPWWQAVPANAQTTAPITTPITMQSMAPTRDYFIVEDHQGRRFWLCRHGLYAQPAEEEQQPYWLLYGHFA